MDHLIFIILHTVCLRVNIFELLSNHTPSDKVRLSLTAVTMTTNKIHGKIPNPTYIPSGQPLSCESDTDRNNGTNYKDSKR
ncbi:hypothetical protein Hanom_Chr17g01554341 [Helianthus anomalus]